MSIQLEEIQEVDVEKIFVNPYQPRREFSQQDLEELAFSIKNVGLIHPPVVRPMNDGNTFELIAGERRFRASKLAGLFKIPVLIRQATNSVSAQAALIENIQRVDLNPLEIAKGLSNLSKELGINQEELARRVGKKRSTVANYLRLLALPINIQEGLSKGLITMGHAKAILSLETTEHQNLLFDLIIRDDLTVRKAETAASNLVKKETKGPSESPIIHNIYLDELVERMQQKFGTKVRIQEKDNQGSIQIDFYNLDDLDRLLELFEL